MTTAEKYATAVVSSTTGTAPISLRRTTDTDVLVTLDDGSAQVYDRADLLHAVLGLYADDGVPAVETVWRVADALGLERPSLAFPDGDSRVSWSA